MLSTIFTSIAHFITVTISTLGYPGVILLMAIESAMIPLPSEIIMPFAGFLASQGYFDLWQLALCGAIGNLIGSLIAYYIGRWGGYPFLERYGRYILVSRRDIEKAHRWFERWGEATAFFSRLLPVVRTFISFPAGIAKMNIWRFSIFTFLGALPFSYFLAYLGFRMGKNWQQLSVIWHKFDLIIAAAIVVGLAWWLWRHIRGLKNQ